MKVALLLLAFAAMAFAVAVDNEQLVLSLSQDACGCLHLDICPCRQVQWTQPEMKPDEPPRKV